MANKTKVLETTIHVGDIVAVHQKINEGDKERIQVFKGAVIAIKGSGSGKSFTVRRIASANIGVERIWPVLCPTLQKIELIRRGKVRRAKLYYLRKKVGKQAVRIKTKRDVKSVKAIKSKSKVHAQTKPGKSGRKPSPKVSKK